MASRLAPCVIVLLAGLALWLKGLPVEVRADDGSVMIDTIRRGLEVREQTLDRLFVLLSSRTTTDAEYADWFAEQWLTHVGFAIEPAPRESFSRYELRKTDQAWYYSETWGLERDDAVAEPLLEVSVDGGQYVRLHRPMGNENGRVTGEKGPAEDVRFEPPVMGFLLLRDGTTPWSAAMAEIGWRWLGTEECGGHLCHVLGSEPQDDEEGALRVWIDPECGFAVTRATLYWPGDPSEVRMDTLVTRFEQDAEGIWLPRSVVVREYSREAGEESFGKHVMIRETVFEAAYRDSSEVLDDAAFEIALPDGTPLYDATTGEVTLVGAGRSEEGGGEPPQPTDDGAQGENG